MPILPKKIDLDAARAKEMKSQIDDGLALAQRVDLLRKTVQDEEKRLKDFRENSVSTILTEIEELKIKKADIVGEIETLERIQNSLLLPDVAKVKETINKLVDIGVDKKNLYLSGETIKQREEEVLKKEVKIKQIEETIKAKELEIDELREKTLRAKKLAEKEQQDIHNDGLMQLDVYEKELNKVKELEQTYKSALAIIDIREKEVNEKVSDIIIREQHIASQQLALEIAMREVKKLQ